MPELKPKWSLSVNNFIDNAIAEDGLVFLVADKKLIAIDANTGKIKYRYGSNLTDNYVYAAGIVYGTTANGKAFALNARTGAQKWLNAISKTPGTVSVVGDTVYYAEGKRTYALNAATGKTKWVSEEPQAEGSAFGITVANGIVFQSYLVQGALTSTQLDAFDAKTGKKLWGVFHQNTPLTVRNGVVYSVYDPYPSPDDDPARNVTINAFDATTGKLMASQVFSWKIASAPPYHVSGGSVLLEGNDLYITTDVEVRKYDFASYKVDGKPLQTWVKPDAEAEFAGPVNGGRLFFSRYGSGEVLGLKLLDGKSLIWYADNPVVATTIYGNGVYVSQSDGVLRGYRLDTREPVFNVHTGSRYFGSTLKTGNTLIIQTPGKLTAVTIPKSML
ncbi:PQQ-binding-like beta-propeller repeat protein [Cohnella sp. AR92]|uniref:outer membrane protein assembly factor BamB family protein n=1 Tax=Cohnella sp. AR92 TaxID=648716 RepID=UPI0013157F4B|nr:PQQ-binding-like beta-propeller repeat protein [Cohnella sp. AR92]